MRLTCPTCRSGLEVPNGTSDLVRCPTCRTVFEPAAGQAPPPQAPRREPEPRQATKKEKTQETRRAPARPAAKDTARAEREPESEEPPKSDYLREKEEREAELAEERRELRDAFDRAAVGCKFLRWSFILYGVSLVLIVVYFILTAVASLTAKSGGGSTGWYAHPGIITVAGILGLLNWIFSLVGLALIIGGPDRPGVRGTAIIALCLGAVHLLLMIALVGRADAMTELATTGSTAKLDGWAQLPTKFVSLSSYLTWVFYRDQGLGPRNNGALYIVIGIIELLRLLMVMVALMNLAKAGGDDDLAYLCVRAGAIVTFVPGILVLGMLGFTAVMVEMNYQHGEWGKILTEVARMSIHLFLALMLIIPTRCARGVADVCEAPLLVKYSGGLL